MATASGTSKYVAVREHLLTRIKALEPGAQLPAEPIDSVKQAPSFRRD